MVSLPLETLKLVQTGVPAYATRAFGCAAFLLVVVIVLFLVARKIGGWGPGHLTRRGLRRVKKASARDVERFAHRNDHTPRRRGGVPEMTGPEAAGPDLTGPDLSGPAIEGLS
jgi:phosphate transport system permease protein